MGQKVHPIGFRLGISKTHLSQWFARKKDYSKYLLEDSFLRKKLKQSYGNAGIEKIEIFRKVENHLELKIHAEKTDILIGKKGENLKKFHQDIKKSIKKYRKSDIKIALYVIGCSQTSASSIADFLIELLEKRIAYRVALNLLLRKKIPKKLLHLKQKSVKIQISGRLNGAEIARREWRRMDEGQGRLPLQTLEANIDYTSKQAHTIYGVLGIKVWVFNTITTKKKE
uniref:Small ribosomal subunit protein uS3c n=1 Tax=Flabellia petiolata TaxID=189428 RepID=A0A386AX55_9CHLO|nr:ribosomal protein S3 [Flabellia petiolata]